MAQIRPLAYYLISELKATIKKVVACQPAMVVSTRMSRTSKGTLDETRSEVFRWPSDLRWATKIPDVVFRRLESE